MNADAIRQLIETGLPGFPEAQTLLASAWELHRHSLQTWGYDGNLGPAIAQGWEQFAPFMVTIVGILATDLLVGIGLGMAVAIFLLLLTNNRNYY